MYRTRGTELVTPKTHKTTDRGFIGADGKSKHTATLVSRSGVEMDDSMPPTPEHGDGVLRWRWRWRQTK